MMNTYVAFEDIPTLASIRFSFKLKIMNLGGEQNRTTAYISSFVVAIPLNAPSSAWYLFSIGSKFWLKHENFYKFERT